jgi:hypothetical protein
LGAGFAVCASRSYTLLQIGGGALIAVAVAAVLVYYTVRLLIVLKQLYG